MELFDYDEPESQMRARRQTIMIIRIIIRVLHNDIERHTIGRALARCCRRGVRGAGRELAYCCWRVAVASGAGAEPNPFRSVRQQSARYRRGAGARRCSGRAQRAGAGATATHIAAPAALWGALECRAQHQTAHLARSLRHSAWPLVARVRRGVQYECWAPNCTPGNQV